MLTRPDLAAVQQSLRDLGLDGWLLFDFRGINPVAARVLGVGGMGSRRLFVLLPREGEPVAVAHKIELGPVRDFPARCDPTPDGRNCTRRWRLDREGSDWRWRSRPRTRCRTSTGFRSEWWSWFAGWAGRWCLPGRW